MSKSASFFKVCFLRSSLHQPTTLRDPANRLSQTLLLPAVISLVLFLSLTYVLLPLYRRTRARYSQYLPVNQPSWGETTSNWRDRLVTRLARFANRREDRYMSGEARAIDHRDEQIDDSEGEELGEVDEQMRRVIESHERTAQRAGETRRLSRE